MSDERLETIARYVSRLAGGQAVEPLALAGDDALANIAADLDRIAARVREQAAAADEALFARGPVVVFRWRNTEGWPVEYVSANVEALTGYPAADFASGKLPYASLIVASDLDRVMQEVAHNAGSSQWFEHLPYRIRCRSGEVLWVYDYTVVLRDAQGLATHFYGYIMDISEQVAKEKLVRDQGTIIESLNSPIIQVWEGILAVPMLGRLDDTRAEQITQAVLERVSQDGARAVIIDFTPVDVVDTSTAMHLGKMIRAVGLLGSECVLSGVSPTVAQTIVALGIDFGDVQLFRTLATALRAVVSQRRFGARD